MTIVAVRDRPMVMTEQRIAVDYVSSLALPDVVDSPIFPFRGNFEVRTLRPTPNAVDGTLHQRKIGKTGQDDGRSLRILGAFGRDCGVPAEGRSSCDVSSGGCM